MLLALSDVNYVFIGWFKLLLLKFLYEYGPWATCFTAVLVTTLANLEGEETYETAFLGHAEEVVQERICDDELILIKG